MRKRVLITMAVVVGVGMMVMGSAQAGSPVLIYELGCDDLAYKWYSTCDDNRGMITTSPDHLLGSGGSWEFSFDWSDPKFKSVMVGTSEQHTDFSAALQGGAILTIVWSPGYSSIERLEVTLDGITMLGRVINAALDDNDQADAKLGEPGDLWYFTEVFTFGPLTGASHTLMIRSLNGDGVGFDYIKLEAVGPTQVEIDIKPGSDPNAINLGSKGVIPVAVLSTASFDAATVDPSTVELAGSSVRVKGKSGNAGSLKDVNGDGLPDLVVQVETENLDPTAIQDGTVCLTGTTYGGVDIQGCDDIVIVPPE